MAGTSVVGHGALIEPMLTVNGVVYPKVPAGKRVVFMSKAGYLGNKKVITDDPKMQIFLKSSEKMVRLIKGTLSGSDLPKYMYPNPGKWKWHEHTVEAGQAYTDMFIDLEDPVPETRHHSPDTIRMYSIYDDMCGVWINGRRTKHGRSVKVSDVLNEMPPGVLFVNACRSTFRNYKVSEHINKPNHQETIDFLHPSHSQHYPRRYTNLVIETARAQNRQGAKKRLLKPRSPTPETTRPPKLVKATVRTPKPRLNRTTRPRTLSPRTLRRRSILDFLRGITKLSPMQIN